MSKSPQTDQLDFDVVDSDVHIGNLVALLYSRVYMAEK